MFLHMTLRASEVVSLKVENIHLVTPSYMNVYGKGAKTRQIPIPSFLENELKTYMTKHHLDEPLKRNNLLFVNNKEESFTRFGIFKMVRKYAVIAHQINPDLVPANLSSMVLDTLGNSLSKPEDRLDLHQRFART